MVAERRNLKDKRGSGVVLASYGRGVLVQSDASTLHCALKGRKQRIVCGDRVTLGVRAPRRRTLRLESIEPRRNLFERIDARGRAEPVAANIDRLAVVVAPEPRSGLVPGRPLLGRRSSQGHRDDSDRQ